MKFFITKTVFILLVSSASINCVKAETTNDNAANTTGNIGFNSEYYYRGILQKTSSAFGGIDYEKEALSAGIWGADVGDGIEYDLYGSYTHDWKNELTTSVGFTGYFYTGEFDDTYKELNFNLGYRWLSVEYSIGTWDGGDNTADNYHFIALTAEHNGLFGKYGTFGDEFSGDYFEFGYGMQVGDFDLGISLILSSDELSDQLNSNGQPTSSEALTISLSKTFDL